MRLITENKKLNFFSHLAFAAFSFYLSFIIFFGVLFGYLAAKYIAKKAVIGTKTNKGRLRLAILKFKNYKFHFHHWFIGAVGLILYLIFFGNNAHFIIAVFGGVIAEDLLCDKNFYKIVVKEKNQKEKK